MDEQILIYAAILIAVIVLTIVGILSRYRKCKSDEVLVVYGKTGDKKSAKLQSSQLYIRYLSGNRHHLFLSDELFY